MYKTAVICDEVSQDIAVAAKLASAYKLDALEIRSVDEKNPFQMTKADALRIKSVADDYGLKICAVGSPLFKCALRDEKARLEHVEALKRVAGFMDAWGTSTLRGFTFMNEHDGEKCFSEIADLYQAAIAVADDARLTIVIESEPSVNTHDIASLIRFLKILDCPRVKALYDPGNEAADTDAPPYPDGYEALKPYIRHVHVKDILRTPGSFVPAMLGEGSVDFKGVFAALKRDYDGYASVETHYRVKHSVSDEDLVHPQGSSFSEGGYEATRLYLDALDQIYHWRET